MFYGSYLCYVQPAQTAATRAELHRRSIAQMKVGFCFQMESCIVSSVEFFCKLEFSLQINNRSIQDMHIFGDPSSIPIVIVERVLNAPRRTTSENSYLRNLDVINSPGLLSGSGSESVNKRSSYSSPKKGRVLKIVVFVHGFQASFVLLQLPLKFLTFGCFLCSFLAPFQCFHCVKSCHNITFYFYYFLKKFINILNLVCWGFHLTFGQNLPAICNNLRL